MTLWNKKTNDMKTLIRTIVILSALVGAAACQQFEIDTQMTPEKEYANLRLICDAVDAYQFASTGAESISFNVSANTPWTITRSSGADWCTVTPSSSASSSLSSDVGVSVADSYHFAAVPNFCCDFNLDCIFWNCQHDKILIELDFFDLFVFHIYSYLLAY